MRLQVRWRAPRLWLVVDDVEVYGIVRGFMTYIFGELHVLLERDLYFWRATYTFRELDSV